MFAPTRMHIPVDANVARLADGIIAVYPIDLERELETQMEILNEPQLR